jgi:hypothetical protein
VHLTNRIVTSGGRADDHSFMIEVQDRRTFFLLQTERQFSRVENVMKKDEMPHRRSQGAASVRVPVTGLG